MPNDEQVLEATITDEAPGASEVTVDEPKGTDAVSPAPGAGAELSPERIAELAAFETERAGWQRQQQEYQDQARVLEVQAEEAQAAETIRTRAAQYEATGQYDAAMAKQIAENEVQRGISDKRLSRANQQNEQLARQVTAQHFARQYGVEAASLLNYSSPEAMELAAKSTSAQSGEIALLRKEISDMKKGTVPAQNFEGGQSDGAGLEGDSLIKALDDGAELTPARRKAAAKALGLDEYA